jgi:RNA polymerase sigma-70 factor (ECF subfamily)
MNPPGFDASYLERLRSGDPETERHFVAYFANLLRIKLRCQLRSRQLIDDASQETFVRVLRAVRSEGAIRSPERLGAFVNSVCENVLQELFRAEQRYRPIAADPPPEPEHDEASAEERLVAAERAALVQRIVNQLPDRDRRLLRALYVEEHEKDEVCAALGVGRAYLRVLLHRAKLQFRALYLEREQKQAPAPPQTLGTRGGMSA